MSSSATSGRCAVAAGHDLVAGGHLGDDLEVVLQAEQQRQRAAHHALVLGEQDPDHDASPRAARLLPEGQLVLGSVVDRPDGPRGQGQGAGRRPAARRAARGRSGRRCGRSSSSSSIIWPDSFSLAGRQARPSPSAKRYGRSLGVVGPPREAGLQRQEHRRLPVGELVAVDGRLAGPAARSAHGWTRAHIRSVSTAAQANTRRLIAIYRIFPGNLLGLRCRTLPVRRCR